MGTELTTKVVGRALEQRTADLQNALGPDIDADRWRMAAVAAVGADPKLQACSPESLVMALVQCATMGATPSSSNTPQTARRVALIPRGGQVTVMPEARYFQEVFRRAEGVVEARATLVLEGDEVDFDAMDNVVRSFKKADPFAQATRETLKGGIVTLVYIDGRRHDHLVPRERIDRGEQAAQTKAIWKSDYAAMALKTLWRDAAARIGASVMDSLGHASKHLGAAVEAFDQANGVEVRNVTPVRKAVGLGPAYEYDGKVKRLAQAARDAVARGCDGADVAACLKAHGSSDGSARTVPANEVDGAIAAVETLPVRPAEREYPPEDWTQRMEARFEAPRHDWTDEQHTQAWALYEEAAQAAKETA